MRELFSRIHPKVEQLFHCPYCLGHWITFVSLFVLPVRASLSENTIIDFLATAFCVMGMVAVLHFVILRAYEPIQKMELQRMLDKMK